MLKTNNYLARTSLFLGVSLLLTLPIVTHAASFSSWAEFTGKATGDQAGYSVAMVGDVNGDGYDDMTVAAMYNSDGGVGAGAVFLLYGSATASTGTQSLSTAAEFTGEAAGDEAGFSVAGAGDVDNDGYDDLLIGAPDNDDTAANAGAIYLVYGQATNYTGVHSLSAAIEFKGEAAGDQAGYSVAGVGDLDNDGFADFLFGAPRNDAAASNAGAVYLSRGRASKFSGVYSLSAATKLKGAAADDRAGYSVAGAGDVNNDGYADFLIGAPNNDDGGSNAGEVYLSYGRSALFTGINNSLANIPIKFTGGAANNSVGSSVAGAGDVNGDGYDDVLVGSYGIGVSGTTYLIYGSTVTSETISLSTVAGFTGEAVTDEIAQSVVAGAGDVNNDGYADFLIGAPLNDDVADNAGVAYLEYGQSSQYTGTQSVSSATKFSGVTDSDEAGFSVAGAGDVNGDGYADMLVGGPGQSDIATGAGYLGYLYIDNDHDGVAGTAGLLSGTDCSDSDSAVYAYHTYYQDADGDGLGNSAITTSVCSASAPTGYVTNSNDANDSVFDSGVDSDGDGVASTSDCDDADSTVSANQTYYRDLDGDGVGGVTTLSICKSTPPTGYARANTDCSDSDGTVAADQTYYQDSDGDGFGNAAVTVVACSSSPSTGYVSNNTDDNDTTFGDIDSTTINDDGTVTVTYTNTATQAIDPFSTSTATDFSVMTSTDSRRVIVTNGKKIKVYHDGVKQTSKTVNKTKPDQTLVKLKGAAFYVSGDTIAVATAHASKGKLTIFRLTSADALVKKHHVTLDLLRAAHTPIKLKLKESTQHIIVTFDKKMHRVKATYLVKSTGALVLAA